MKKILKKMSRGFTIFEVVITMSIIAICTGSTISLLERSRDISSKAFYYYEARELANNALEVFKYADNELDFYSGLGYLDQRFNKEGYLYYYENNLYRVEVTAVFNEYHNGYSTFQTIGYQSNGHILFKCYYEKR